MKNQFVTYPLSKKLKELGFDNECLGWYMPPNQLIYDRKCPKSFKNLNSEMFNGSVCSAPLWQQIIDWFETKFNLYIKIIKTHYKDKNDEIKSAYYFIIEGEYKEIYYNDFEAYDLLNQLFNKSLIEDKFNFETKYEALVKAVETAIEIVKNLKNK